MKKYDPRQQYGGGGLYGDAAQTLQDGTASAPGLTPVAAAKIINRENRFRARIDSSDTLYNTGIQTVGINFEPR